MFIYLSMIDSEAGQSKFEVIYSAYKNLMLYHANQILGDAHESEDVVHEAFLKIIKILDRIDVPKCPKTRSLVVTIVERKAIDVYRSRKRRAVVPFGEEYINVPAPSEIDDLPNRSALAVAIALLPTKYREVLLLKYDLGLSDREIAEVASMTEANVRKTIQRAKAKLSENLEGQEG